MIQHPHKIPSFFAPLSIVRRSIRLATPRDLAEQAVMSEFENRRKSLQNIARSVSSRAERTRRIFLSEPSFAFRDDRTPEFEIKSAIAEYFGCPYGSVIFCGSAQLGLSPHKDRVFTPGRSDLDVAITDFWLFQQAWSKLVDYTRAFSNLTVFPRRPMIEKEIEYIKSALVRRGMISLKSMPRGKYFDDARNFLDIFSGQYSSIISEINVAFFLSEEAFIWKQDSALQLILKG